MTDSQKTMLEMLTSREQLMEDIICIVDGMLENVDIDDEDKETMITGLCDAVCANFPVVVDGEVTGTEVVELG